MNKTISVIIPTLNEAAGLAALVDYLSKTKDRELIKEIIISDGNSSDATCEIASQFGIHISNNPVAGRAKQMNAGALHATVTFFISFMLIRFLLSILSTRFYTLMLRDLMLVVFDCVLIGITGF